MLPAVAPNARIMRYGYESNWFGESAIQQNASRVANRLLRALKRERKVKTCASSIFWLLTSLGIPISADNIHSPLLRRLSCAKGE
jgi:hypothetical protein